MKLEKQVCSLELSKKLKELGCKQDSLWWWSNYYYDWERDFEGIVKNPLGKFDITKDNFDFLKETDREHLIPNDLEIYSAFTVAELAEMLESGWNDDMIEVIFKDCDHWFIRYKKFNNAGEYELKNCEAENLADCLAKMLIWLIENKHMEAK